jgi:pSer/pThr/pTyr-binding forkhead associated (FHA) protein
VSIEALATDETFLILKIAFLVLLYLFIILIARTATKDIEGPPQESIVLGAAEAAHLRAEHGVKPARFAVVTSPDLPAGSAVEVTGPTTLGRERGAGILLEGDDYVSARHARLEPRPDGTWIEDLASTNGTFVNGARIDGARRLQAGDVIRVGSTELELER